MISFALETSFYFLYSIGITAFKKPVGCKPAIMEKNKKILIKNKKPVETWFEVLLGDDNLLMSQGENVQAYTLICRTGQLLEASD